MEIKDEKLSRDKWETCKAHVIGCLVRFRKIKVYCIDSQSCVS